MQANLILYINKDDTILYAEEKRAEDITPASKVLVLVPAEDVLITTVKLPKLNRNKLHEAIPFAMEEQLINDIDELHFATGEYLNDAYPIAIVTHQKMRAWLDKLSALGIKPNVMAPISLIMPMTENHCHITIVNDIVVICINRFSVYTTDLDNLTASLQSVMESHPDFTAITIHNYTEKAYANDLKLPVPVTETLLNTQHLLTNLTDEVPINLLQHQYAIKKSHQPNVKKIWYAVGLLSILFFVSLMIYPMVSYVILHQKYAAIEGEIKSIYKSNFPLATSVVAPRQRMEDKLKKLNSNPKDARLFLNLATLGTATRDANIKLNRIDFQNNQLSIVLTAITSEDLASFISSLEQLGLQVKQQNAAMSSDRMNATILIE